MRHFATTGLLLALLALAATPITHAQATHDTGVVTLEVRSDGFIGASGFLLGDGFTFEGGTNALFEGQLIVGVSGTQVSGEAYAGTPGQATPEWAEIAPIGPLDPPFDPPFEEFGEGYESMFDDSAANNSAPIGLDVHQRSYASSGDSFVIVEFTVTNTSGSDIPEVYIGTFNDWDVGGATTNLGDYDAGTKLLYVTDTVVPEVFGVAVLGEDATVSGWELDAGAGTNPTQQNLYDALTNGGGVVPAVPADRRTVIGSGPYAIAAGASQVVRFAYIGGADVASLIASAAAAQEAVMPVAIEPGPDGLPGTHNLSSVYPNPFNPQASFSLEVAEQQNVRIALIDALGREVATLFEGTLSAGSAHEFQIDGQNLPSGLYLVRATGERFAETRQVTLLK